MNMLCVLLPHFPLRCEIQRRPGLEQRCAVVTYVTGSQRLVLDHSPELKNLQPGMAIQQALSLEGPLELITADIVHYRSIFNRILGQLENKSPLVEGAGLGQAYLGLDGMNEIYRDNDAVTSAVRKVIPEAFPAQMGIAEGKFLAYLAALHSSGNNYLTLADNISTFLKDIPCGVLPVSAKSKNKLHDFGLHTLGQVAILASSALEAQFGPEGKKIWELARGYDDSPLYPRAYQEVIEESTCFPSMAVNFEAILVAAESLLIRVFARESLKGKAIRNLVIWANIEGTGYWERNIRFKEPAANAAAALSRIKQIMQLFPLPGPAEDLGVRLAQLCYQKGKQGSLFSEVRAKDHLLEDIKQLEFRLGSPQVFRLRKIEPWSRIPERRLALTQSSQ